MKRSLDEMADSDKETLETQQSDYKTKSIEVERELRLELHGAVFVETTGFFDKFFEIPSAVVGRIKREARKQGYYDGSKWKAFPRMTNSTTIPEKALYKPFVDAANFITGQCLTDPKPAVRWLSDPNRSPISTDAKAADMEPDIVCVRGFPEAVQPEAKADGRAASQSEAGKKPQRAPKAKQKAPKKASKALKKPLKEPQPPKAPWRYIQVPMEVKRESSDRAASLQLFKYIRQIFHESFDRRFVFGMVLARSNITVYLADRSGVLGSKTFDMHEEPELLIRVIAGFAMFKLTKLGWDTSMTVVPRQLTNQAPRMSFEVPPAELEVGQYWHNHLWRVEMPKPLANEPLKMSNDTEAFVFFKHLSLSRGEVILGRATRVWKAWREDEMELPASERTVYIVKDTWRDDRRPLEGELYARIGPCGGVAEVYSYSVVQIEGKDDITSSLIRCNLLPTGRPRYIDAVQKRNYPLTSPGNDTHLITQYVVDYLPEIPDGQTHVRSCTHSRLVMKTYGWPIKYAKSLLELVGSMKDTIRAHRFSYEQRVLHRDISVGNILITGKSEHGWRGALIDYDNAIIWNDHKVLADGPLSGTRPFMSSEMLQKKYIFMDSSRSQVPSQQKAPVHDAVHDLEGFFWVLVWVCLSRDGPAHCRAELLPDNKDPQHEPFRTVFTDLFEESDKVLALTKRDMFRTPEEFEESVLWNLSTYSAPLETLLRDFHLALENAHRSHNSEGLYEKVIDAFTIAEEMVAQLPADITDKYSALEKAEEERRARDNKGHWDVHSPLMKRMNVSHGTPNALMGNEPTSPTPPAKRPKR